MRASVWMAATHPSYYNQCYLVPPTFDGNGQPRIKSDGDLGHGYVSDSQTHEYTLGGSGNYGSQQWTVDFDIKMERHGRHPYNVDKGHIRWSPDGGVEASGWKICTV